MGKLFDAINNAQKSLGEKTYTKSDRIENKREITSKRVIDKNKEENKKNYSVKNDTIDEKKQVRKIKPSEKSKLKQARINIVSDTTKKNIGNVIEGQNRPEIIHQEASATPQYIIVQQSENDNNKMPENNKPVEINKLEITQKLLRLRQNNNKLGLESSEYPEEKKLFRLRKRRYFVHSRQNTIISENIRAIRSHIFKNSRENSFRTILVTSSKPYEGKSFIAANLAVSIASGFDKHILLVDTDFKKPTIHNYFDLDVKCGLTDFLLSDQLEFSNIIKKTKIAKLSKITAGNRYDNASELVNSEIMRTFIEEVKYRYDDRIVIFDSPPAQISDAIEMAGMVDGIIMVARVGATEIEIAKKTVSMMNKNKIIGFVLNNYKLPSNSYYSYYNEK